MAGTILLVDDEQDLVDTLRYSLEREGYTTLAARDGAAALDVLGHSQPPVPSTRTISACEARVS